MSRDYRKDIVIDESNLEKEWIEHPSLVLYYNELWVAAVFERDKKKIELETIAAQLDSKIRKNWERYFDSKPTEVAIKNYITSDPKYKKKERELLEAVKQANLMTGVKNSFEHRKNALQNIVSLRISGFHSEPRNVRKDLNRKMRSGAMIRSIRKKKIKRKD